MKIISLYLPVVFDVIQWAAHVKSYRAKGFQGRVLNQVTKYKGFSLTMANSLATCANKLAEFIGVDSDVRTINLKPTHFVECLVLVDITMTDSD